MKHVIITGASKGLGAELVKKWLEEGAYVYGISRTTNDRFKTEETEGRLRQYAFDVSDAKHIPQQLHTIFEHIQSKEVRELILINNAGVVEPVAKAEHCDPDDIEKSLQINVLAPMVFTGTFIRMTENIQAKKLVVNISSGAGSRPVSGWSAYCTTKAGLNLYTKTVALEQENVPSPVKVVAFAPGVVDTPMQATIRSSKKEDFADVEQFRQLKENEQLLPPSTVADVLYQITEDNNIEQGAFLDVRQFLT